jgi:hypothetical protein
MSGVSPIRTSASKRVDGQGKRRSANCQHQRKSQASTCVSNPVLSVNSIGTRKPSGHMSCRVRAFDKLDNSLETDISQARSVSQHSTPTEDHSSTTSRRATCGTSHQDIRTPSKAWAKTEPNSCWCSTVEISARIPRSCSTNGSSTPPKRWWQRTSACPRRSSRTSTRRTSTFSKVRSDSLAI